MVALPSYSVPVRPHADVVTEIDVPRWPGAVRMAVLLIPNIVAWALIGLAVAVLMICSAREAAYAAQHPQPVADVSR